MGNIFKKQAAYEYFTSVSIISKCIKNNKPFRGIIYGREYKSFIIRYSQVKYESIYVVMLKRIHRE